MLLHQQQQQHQALQLLQQQQQQQQTVALIQRLSQQLALQQLQGGYEDRPGLMPSVGPPSSSLGGLPSNNPYAPPPRLHHMLPTAPQAFLPGGPGVSPFYSPGAPPMGPTSSQSQAPEHDLITWTTTTAVTATSHPTGSAAGSWVLGSLPPAPISAGSPVLGGFPLLGASSASGGGGGGSFSRTSSLPPLSPWNPAVARAQLQAGLRHLPTFSSVTTQSSLQSNPPLITSATVGSLMCSATVGVDTCCSATSKMRKVMLMVVCRTAQV
jgi:hypothetical protein